jgi:hypothetical protein
MDDLRQPIAVQADMVREEGPDLAASLGALVARLWPADLSSSRRAGLPAGVADVLRPGRTARRLRRVTEELDRALPGWPELAAAAVAGAAKSALEAEAQRLCLLLARRELRAPEPLLAALQNAGEAASTRLWLLVALAGTDTAAVRARWREELASVTQCEALVGSAAAWFAFARAMLGGWLGWPEFRDWLVTARALAGAGTDYCLSLEGVGLWTQPLFARWYRQVVYETTHQPDAPLSFAASGWILDFDGADYLYDAVAQVDRDPTSWWPLHVLRWTSGVDADGEALAERLRECSPPALCLLSLVRPDLAAAAGRALDLAEHEAVVSWLLSRRAPHAADPRWVEAVLRPWAERVGDAFAVALRALDMMYVPPDFDADVDADGRAEAYIGGYLVPGYRSLLDRRLYLLAVRREGLAEILAAARQGRPAAAYALILWPEQAEHAVPVLFALRREGGRAMRAAAQEALDQFARRLGVADLARLERRVDLAAAWPDLDMGGKAARAWWDVAGFHVRLSVARGEVTLEVYSGARRLAAVPARLRAAPEWAEIRRCREQLAGCYRYFRRRFEQAMVERVEYRGGDFAALLANPVVRSLAARLVLDVDGRPWRWAPEDPVHECEVPPQIAAAARISVAHPAELHAAGALVHWQQQAVEQRLPQPFKQLFREIYLAGEKELGLEQCDRFSGYPLIARQAFALLRRRGYVPGKGEAAKEWPALGLRSCIAWAAPDQPAGKLVAQGPSAPPVTSGAVRFEWLSGGPAALGDVPLVAFSETMRDADLLVSLAAFGGGGFTSEETRRLRASLVRHVARALRLTTIYVSDDETHVIVDGTRALYRVHLGSGSVLLEESRRHLDTSALATPVELSLVESVDSLTARIVGLIVALSHDDRITEPAFIAQLTPDQ